MNIAAPLSIEDAVYQRAARLLAVQHAVAEVFGGRKVDADPVAIKEAVLCIRAAVRKSDGAYATFIGGLAVQQLGYERWTDDVDVVVDAAHYGEVLENLRAVGFVLKADFTLVQAETGAKVDLLKEGIRMKDALLPLPHPALLGPNLGFATINGVIRLKLDARRRQDMADIVAVLKPRLAQLDAIRASLPIELQADFDSIAAEARREAAP